tara:strand:- start:123 stop:320 length:198 start_codon:yes stop_codon:yes gene_type:complete
MGSGCGEISSLWPLFYAPQLYIAVRFLPHSDVALRCFDHKKSSCAGSIGFVIFAEMAGARGARRR